MSQRHKAPRRKVEALSHTTGYGSTWWMHRLECGHVEQRKRRSPASTVGCSACLNELRKQTQVFIELRGLPDEAAVQEDDVAVELQAQKIAAEVASRLAIPSEMVGVQIGSTPSGLKIEGVQVWIPRLNAISMLNQSANQ